MSHLRKKDINLLLLILYSRSSVETLNLEIRDECREIKLYNMIDTKRIKYKLHIRMHFYLTKFSAFKNLATARVDIIPKIKYFGMENKSFHQFSVINLKYLKRFVSNFLRYHSEEHMILFWKLKKFSLNLLINKLIAANYDLVD